MPIAIDSESSTPVETPMTTDEQGRVQRLIRSSDTVTISSLYPAISFTPISGQAMELSLMGDVAVSAQRLVEQSGSCRQLNDQAQEEIVFKFFNITDATLNVETDENLNYFTSASGTPIAIQSPRKFESGPGQFSVLLSELRGSEGADGSIGARWKFLASESSFSFRENIDLNPVPVCEGAIINPCSPVSDQALDAIFERAAAEVKSLFNYSVKIRKKNQVTKSRLPYMKTGATALRNIKGLVLSLRGKTYTCATTLGRCRQSQFPRRELERHFEAIFNQAPPVAQKQFHRYGKSAADRFRKFLTQRLSSDAYICE
jgi:hypothetical protein